MQFTKTFDIISYWLYSLEQASAKAVAKNGVQRNDLQSDVWRAPASGDEGGSRKYGMERSGVSALATLVEMSLYQIVKRSTALIRYKRNALHKAKP